MISRKSSAEMLQPRAPGTKRHRNEKWIQQCSLFPPASTLAYLFYHINLAFLANCAMSWQVLRRLKHLNRMITKHMEGDSRAMVIMNGNTFLCCQRSLFSLIKYHQMLGRSVDLHYELHTDPVWISWPCLYNNSHISFWLWLSLSWK